MQILTILTEAGNIARRGLSRGEQSMLIDVFNGTMLTSETLGQHLIVQVEDSFSHYPGIYEEKWGIDREDMLRKINRLTRLGAAMLELWIFSFWAIKGASMEAYIDCKTNLSIHMKEIITRLEAVSESLEKTKGAFKSASVAKSRETIEEAASLLGGML